MATQIFNIAIKGPSYSNHKSNVAIGDIFCNAINTQQQGLMQHPVSLSLPLLLHFLYVVTDSCSNAWCVAIVTIATPTVVAGTKTCNATFEQQNDSWCCNRGNTMAMPKINRGANFGLRLHWQHLATLKFRCHCVYCNHFGHFATLFRCCIICKTLQCVIFSRAL